MDDALDRRQRLPAWTASLCAHAVLLSLVVWATAPGEPSGAAEEPTREIGVVLKRSPIEPLEAADETPEAPPVEATEPANDPSPEPPGLIAGPESPSAFAGLLEELTAEGPSRPADGGGEGASDRGAGRGRALPIGQARVAFFGLEGTGSRFAYVLDRSISMAGPPLATAKRQLAASLASLDEIHQFQIVFFNHRLSIPDLTGGQRRVAQATDQNQRLAADYLRGVTADGSTDRYAALAHALRLRPDVVFFLTDADGPMTPDEMRRISELNYRIGATINTVEFGKGPRVEQSNFLTELADQTGGAHGYVDTLRLSRQ